MRVTVLAAVVGLIVGCKPREAEAPRLAPSPGVAARSTWALDPENSSVSFACPHVFTVVRGLFAQPAGTVIVDVGEPAKSSVVATVQTGSIFTGVEERDTHLKSADFFDVAQFPSARFESTSVSASSATAWTVVGNLSLHGHTKPVTLAVTLSPPFPHAGGTRRAVAASAKVNRRDFGITWDFPGEPSGSVVGDEIALTLDAELVLQP
ncbi:MAG: YceI family protein [Myxococcaceae bacterium]